MTQVITPRFENLSDCIFVDKVSGINTHAPDIGKWGLAEVLEKYLGQDLFVVHRLDKGTSGVIVFAKSADVAKELGEVFETRKAVKRYVFLTDKPSQQQNITVKSYIRKDRGLFFSSFSEAPNSETEFRFIKKIGNHFLWEAFPKTGKPHQIRLHAEASHIPILGDDEHGGSPYPRLCLHAESLEFPLKGKTFKFESALPFWAEREVDSIEAALLTGLDRRERMFHFSKLEQQSLRLVHQENPMWRLDQYGSVWWVYWYGDGIPSDRHLQLWKHYGDLHNKKVLVRHMLNRGEDPNSEVMWDLHPVEPRWNSLENSLLFELRQDTGLSPGLFLDQRENRNWVLNNSEGKSVLNLFSYTCGFSLAAAKGGAKEVISVDASQNFLDWGRHNFELNGLDANNYEFWAADCLFFLKGCQRRTRKFDLIICDPPSFGRSKNGTFSISKDFNQLIIDCLFALGKGGKLLFTTNYEKWNEWDLKDRFKKLRSEFSFHIEDAPLSGMDFELPGDETLMKGVLITKK